MGYDLTSEEKKKKAYDYVNRYQKENYERITVLCKPGEKEAIEVYAKEHGFSVSQFMRLCAYREMMENMEKEKKEQKEDGQHGGQETAAPNDN